MAARRTLVWAMAVLLAIPALVFGATAAHADLYRYWSFWERENGSWVFVEVDPAAVIPANGAVNGWRYGVGGVDSTTNRPPRSKAAFAEICGTAPSPPGEKRVAVVIDTGTAEDAPVGVTPPEPFAVCATVDVDANAVQILQSVANTRTDGGLVCGIENYPNGGCGDVVAGATAVPSDSPTEFALPSEEVSHDQESGAPQTPVALIALTAVAVAIAVVGVVVARNRRR